MSTIAAALLSGLLLYKYFLLFGVFFLSALALPLPGNTLLFAAGAFASQGYMNFWYVLASVLAGNVLGDLAGYLLAARYGERIVRMFRIKRSYLDTIEGYVRKHPRPTIILSRFGGSLDPAVNVLSGMGGVPLRIFLTYDIVGNVISLFLVITAGYYLGDYWQSFSGVISTIGWILFAALAIGGIIVIYRRQVGIKSTSTTFPMHQVRKFWRTFKQYGQRD